MIEILVGLLCLSQLVIGATVVVVYYRSYFILNLLTGFMQAIKDMDNVTDTTDSSS